MLFSFSNSDLTRELNHGGSLSSHIMVPCRIQLLGMFKIVLLKRETFSLILVLEKAFSQLQLFLHGNHRWDQFLFFLTGTTQPVVNKTMYRNDEKMKSKVRRLRRRKRLKCTSCTNRQNLRHYLESFSEACLGSSRTSTMKLVLR